MKKNIFLYLFVFSLLLNILQYVNSSKILQNKDVEVQHVKKQLQLSRDSIATLQQNDYFDLMTDEDAQEYFFTRNIDFTKAMAKVNDDLNEMNTRKNGNPLIPYEPIDGKAFVINKAKILNHRWIIAEYTNSDLWGQILVKYFINEDGTTEFETIDTILYERQKVE
ncbi:hydrolase [Flavobacterium sp.]|uniref:hydrolase n=1 Tax=Flavobacterium sp. TaxID=239 RepID=UPI0035287A5C